MLFPKGSVSHAHTRSHQRHSHTQPCSSPHDRLAHHTSAHTHMLTHRRTHTHTHTLTHTHTHTHTFLFFVYVPMFPYFSFALSYFDFCDSHSYAFVNSVGLSPMGVINLQIKSNQSLSLSLSLSLCVCVCGCGCGCIKLYINKYITDIVITFPTYY